MLALTNARIFTMQEGVLEDATLIIEDGRISAVGQEVRLPEAAEKLDLEGKNVLPGLIDAHTHIGIGEESIGWEGKDYNETSDPATPHLQAIDAINPRDRAFRDALQGGVTTVMTGPGSANVLGGQSTVLKTAGSVVDRMVLRKTAGLKGALGENPKRVYGREQKKSPVTRMAMAAIMRENLTQARYYLRQKKAAREENQPEKVPEPDLKMESLQPVLTKELPLRVHAHRADDIMTALRIAREFDIDITLEHCTEGHLVAEEIARAGVPAVIGPSLTSRSKVELKERTFETAAALHRAGVKVALMSDHPVIPLQYLPLVAALAVKAGLPYHKALHAITADAAEILGVDHRVGSIAPGMDADLVVFNGDPLEVMTTVEMVFANGQRQELENPEE